MALCGMKACRGCIKLKRRAHWSSPWARIVDAVVERGRQQRGENVSIEARCWVTRGTQKRNGV
jgi:hypothetical protein